MRFLWEPSSALLQKPALVLLWELAFLEHPPGHRSHGTISLDVSHEAEISL